MMISPELGVFFYIPTGVSFTASVAPIITASCSTIDCHGGSQSPDFRVFENIRNNASKIKEFTESGFMPQSGSLTPEEINLIGCWVDDGALDN